MKYSLFMVILLLGSFVLAFDVAIAQQSYQLLDGTIGFGSTYTTTGDDASFSRFINTAFNIGITVAVLLAVIMIVLAGVEYMGSDSIFSKASAKNKLWNAIIGLIMALGIYLFLSTINPDLVNLNFKMQRVTLPDTGTTTATRAVDGSALGGSDFSTKQEMLNKILADETSARLYLDNINKNILVKNACTSLAQTSGCVSLGTLPRYTFDYLSRIQKKCNCQVFITGGTEFWMHQSHRLYMPIVDLRHNPQLDAYIKQTGRKGVSTTFIRGRSIDYYDLQPLDGNGRFYDEDAAHWHVVFP